jgi:hypothetical protein
MLSQAKERCQRGLIVTAGRLQQGQPPALAHRATARAMEERLVVREVQTAAVHLHHIEKNLLLSRHCRSIAVKQDRHCKQQGLPGAHWLNVTQDAQSGQARR